MDKFSFLGNADVSQVEALFEQYKKAPDSVEPSWKEFFDGFEFARTSLSSSLPDGKEKKAKPDEKFLQKEFKVINLINGYRTRGHLFTKTNPVRERRKYFPTLDIENFGLEKADLETVFQGG